MTIESIADGVTHAITIVESLRKVAIKDKDTEVVDLLADLSRTLSDVRLQLADSKTENADLKSKIFELNEGIIFLRNRLVNVETTKDESHSKQRQASPQREKILKILLYMSQSARKRGRTYFYTYPHPTYDGKILINLLDQQYFLITDGQGGLFNAQKGAIVTTAHSPSHRSAWS